MQINTKYNIGDKALIYDNWGKLVPVVIKSVGVHHLYENEKPSIVYNVRVKNLRELQEYYEDSIYINIEEVIAKEKEEEQIDLKIAAENFSNSIEVIKKKYAQTYKYLEEYEEPKI